LQVAELGPITQLFAPASGALFAKTKDGGLMRSDDGGLTWRSIGLPPDTTVATVDPRIHTTVYAAGANGVYISTDDAATWRRILRPPDVAYSGTYTVAVSPADSQVVYVGVTTGRPSYEVLGSQDQGGTWHTQNTSGPISLCGPYVRFWPHPTQPRRALQSVGCSAGHTWASVHGQGIDQTRDAGGTWVEGFSPDYQAVGNVVGGSGAQPNRF
jgi:photosystem II stability/assembly factor-like uncharacterized protein